MGQVLGPVNYHFGAFDREYRSTYSILANCMYFIKHLLLFGYRREAAAVSACRSPALIKRL